MPMVVVNPDSGSTQNSVVKSPTPTPTKTTPDVVNSTQNPVVKSPTLTPTKTTPLVVAPNPKKMYDEKTSPALQRLKEREKTFPKVNKQPEAPKKSTGVYRVNTPDSGNPDGGSSGSSSDGSPDGGSSSKKKSNSKKKKKSVTYKGNEKFPITPQAMYVYYPDKKKTYRFDGVIKASHSMTLKQVEEIPEGEEGLYVNNAKNEPNKVTFDIIMSNVYTTRNDLTKKKKDRSEAALNVLNDLKRQRVLLHVVTNLMTYKNMLLAGIALTQDDGTTHFGFYGQLTFQEKTELTSSGGSGTSDSNSTVTPRTGSNSSGRTPARWVDWVGENFV